MGHKKSKQSTKIYLENASLPKHGKTYTVVSHKDVMDHTSKLLSQNNFKIINQTFKTNYNANVAQGIYNLSNINIKNDEDLNIMFAWTNSYDKSTRFQCSIGANVLVCSNGVIQGDLANYGRKHTGTANIDVALAIAKQISKAKNNYNQIINDKNNLKNIKLSIKEQSQFLGRLFVEKQLLDTQQLSCVKFEINKPTYNYGVDPETAWMFYNHVTHAFKSTHPRDWMINQAKFHEFMMSELLSNLQIQFRDTAIDPDDIDSYDIENTEEILNDNVGPNIFNL